MNRKVLVLNLDYSPITVCTVQRAFLLVFLKKAELLSEAKSFCIRTVSTTFPMPAVIKLSSYVKVPFKGVVLSRQNIFRRDNFECQYCGTCKELTIDHVMPRSRNGKSSWSNLVTACKRCNARKGDFTPEEAGMIPKVKPFKPSYIMFLRDFSGMSYEEWKPFLESGVDN